MILRLMQVTKVDKGIYSCDNCGAHAQLPWKITHYANCKRGESKYWQAYYEQAYEEELDQKQTQEDAYNSGRP